MYIDRVSILGGQRGAYRGTGTDQAPDTPTGLTVSPNQTSMVMYSNAVSPAPTGYAFYRRQPGGVWVELGTNSSSPAWLDQYLTCNTEYEYMITAYKEGTGTHVESVVSSPVKRKTLAC